MKPLHVVMSVGAAIAVWHLMWAALFAESCEDCAPRETWQRNQPPAGQSLADCQTCGTEAGKGLSVLRSAPPARPLPLARIAILTMAVRGEDPRGPRKTTRIVTYADKTADISDISLPNMQRYAAYHGYDLVVIQSTLDATRPLAWSKIRGMQKLLVEDGYDWVLWMDADALFSNYSRTVEAMIEESVSVAGCSPNSAFFVASNNNTLNSGVMLAQNTPGVVRLLADLYAVWRPTFQGLQDNRAVIELLGRHAANVPEFVCRLWDAHAYLLQAYPHTTSVTAWANYKPGVWIVHITGPCSPFCRITAELVELCATYPGLPECAAAMTLRDWRPMSPYGRELAKLPPEPVKG